MTEPSPHPMIAHVTQPVTEGVAKAVLDLVTHQCGVGLTVAVACNPDADLAEQVRAVGAEVLPWRAGRELGRAVVRETADLRILLKLARPQLLHLHSSKAGLAGRLAAHGCVPTVFQPHGWSFLAVGPVEARAAVAWERRAARWTAATVVVSGRELEMGNEKLVFGPARPVLIPNAVDTDRFAPAPPVERERLRRRFGLGTDPVVVCVGRLSRQKAQDRLLAAWPRVLQAVPSARLVLVGDGPERANHRAIATPRVSFLGNRSDIADILRAADLFVMPSRWEGMSIAMLEAMASGLSVVATDVGGVAETVGNGAGVITTGEPGDLAAHVSKRLLSPRIAHAEGRIGRSLALAHHRVDTHNSSFLGLYTDLVGTLRPAPDLLIAPEDAVSDQQGPPAHEPSRNVG